MKKYILTFISLMLLAMSSIMTFAMGRGEDKDYYYNNSRNSLRDELVNALSHGELSDQEKSDMEAIRSQLEKSNSIYSALVLAVYEEKTGSTVDDTRLKAKFSKNNFARPLYEVANAYSVTLPEIVFDDSYTGQEMTELINMAEQETHNELELIETAFDNADDEDLKTTYLFLQNSSIAKLRKLSDIQISHGISPSDKSLATLDNNTQNFAVKNYDVYPAGLKSFLEANNTSTQDLRLINKKSFNIAMGKRGRGDYDNEMDDDFDDEHHERFEDRESEYRRDKKRNKR